ncbi:DUF6890 family protein [Zobellella sp. An-6]
MLALRRHYLPHEPDDEEALARAIWLDRKHWEHTANAITAGISKAVNG